MIMFFFILAFSCHVAKLEDAREQYVRGNYFAAASAYRQLYRSTSSASGALRGVVAFEMAENYRRLNQSSNALAAYHNTLRYGYPDTIALFQYARMLHREGDYGAAEEAYRRYLGMRADDLLAQNGLKGVELAKQWVRLPSRYIVRREPLFLSSRSEFCPVYHPQRDELYFTSSRNDAIGDELSPVTGMKCNDLFRSVKNRAGEWQKPERIDSEVNTEGDEGIVTLSSDGKWMFYTGAGDAEGQIAIFRSLWSNGRWSAGEALEIVPEDTLSLFAHPALNPSGDYLYFVSDRPGGYGGKDLWRAKIRNYQEILSVENLGPEINTPGDELFPFLRNDSTLYYSSDGHPGMGGLDLFEAVWKSPDGWTVSNLRPPLNSSADDFGITFEHKGEQGFFSSNRNDVRGYDHIYSFLFRPISVKVEGLAYNPEDELVPGVTVEIVGEDGSKMKQTTDQLGEYWFDIKNGVNYQFMASAEGYLNCWQTLQTVPAEKDTLYYVDFEMIPFHRPVVIEQIYYDFDSADLRPESQAALDTLAAMLNDHPSLVIQLTAHTDRKGSDEYNQDLSQRRAQSVVDWLIKQGVSPRRLSAQGMGKSNPFEVSKRIAARYDFLKEGDILADTFIETLSPAQQQIADQINRRTTFEIVDNQFGLH